MATNSKKTTETDATAKKTTRKTAGGNGDSAKTATMKSVGGTWSDTNPQTPTRRSEIVNSNDDERRRMIAEAAYYRAERRGFQNGDPAQDWIEAEHEVDAKLAQRGTARARRNQYAG